MKADIENKAFQKILIPILKVFQPGICIWKVSNGQVVTDKSHKDGRSKDVNVQDALEDICYLHLALEHQIIFFL